MRTRIPSLGAQDSLVRLLLQGGGTRRDLLDVLRSNDLGDLAASLPRSEDDRDALSRGIRFLAERRVLTGELLDAAEAAHGDLGAGPDELRVDLELSPPPNPLLDTPQRAALKRAAREAGLHRGAIQARLKHRLPLRNGCPRSTETPPARDLFMSA